MKKVIKIPASLNPITINDCFINDQVIVGLDFYVKYDNKFQGVFTASSNSEFYADNLFTGYFYQSLYKLSSDLTSGELIILELKEAEEFDLVYSSNYLRENKYYYVKKEDSVIGPFLTIDYKDKNQRLKNVERMRNEIALKNIYVPSKKQSFEKYIN